jgi:hypothetical protein
MLAQLKNEKERVMAPNTVPNLTRTSFSKAVAAILVFITVTLVLTPLSLHEKPELTKSTILSKHYEQRGKGPWSWWLCRAYFLNQPSDAILMGDSQMNAAIMQADAITSHKNLDVLTDREAITLEQTLKDKAHLSIGVVNLALAGAMISDQYLISKALLASHPPKIVIIGISPRSFLDNAMPAASATEPFHFFQHYVKLDSLVPYSFPDWLSQANWFLQEYFPLKQFYDPITLFLEKIMLYAFGFDRSNESAKQSHFAKIAESFHKDRVDKTSKQLQAICGGTDEPARGKNLVAPISLYGFVDNTGEYKRRYRDSASPNYEKQNAFFREYLSLLKRLGVKTIVLGMPVLPSNRQLLPEVFWRKYKEQMKEECAQFGANWIDLCEDGSFDKGDFLDNVHLNAKGGRLLIDQLSGIISAHSSI